MAAFPRPYVYLDADIVNAIRSLLYGSGRVQQRAALREILAREAADWTLFAGDTVEKEVRVPPSASHELITNAMAVLARYPYLRQSNGEFGGHFGMRFGNPYARFRAFVCQVEGHLGAHPRDAKLLADAIENAMDYVLSYDGKFARAWHRIVTRHTDEVRSLVEEAGRTFAPRE
jgi:hypothetical protein